MNEPTLSVAQALTVLERAILWLDADLHPVFPDQFRLLLRAVRFLEATLQETPASPPRSPQEAEAHREAQYWATEARVYLAAYAPHGRSSALPHVRLRLRVTEVVTALLHAVRAWQTMRGEEERSEHILPPDNPDRERR